MENPQALDFPVSQLPDVPLEQIEVRSNKIRLKVVDAQSRRRW